MPVQSNREQTPLSHEARRAKGTAGDVLGQRGIVRLNASFGGERSGRLVRLQSERARVVTA